MIFDGKFFACEIVWRKHNLLTGEYTYHSSAPDVKESEERHTIVEKVLNFVEEQ